MSDNENPKGLTDSTENKDENIENLDNESENFDENSNLDEDLELEDENEAEEEGKEETVPLSVYMKEKNKRKSLSKELEDLKDKSYDLESKQFLDETKNELVDAGLDEDIASKLASRMAKLMDSKSSSKDKYESIYEDINDLASEDDFFADAMEYKEQIAKKIILAKKVGQKMTPEEAYFALRGKTRLKELKNKTDKKKSIQSKNKDLVESTKSASGSKGNSNKYKLDNEERKILAELQKAQPDAKWTAEKYYKLMK